jgi:hypothetical protein
LPIEKPLSVGSQFKVFGLEDLGLMGADQWKTQVGPVLLVDVWGLLQFLCLYIQRKLILRGIRMPCFPWERKVFVSISNNSPNQEGDEGSDRQQQESFSAMVVRVHETASFGFRKSNSDGVRFLYS